MQNTINMVTINKQYQTGIFFTLLESLIENQNIKFILDTSPAEIEQRLEEAKINNIKWQSLKNSHNLWELNITKSSPIEENVGCCGMCGHHGSNEAKG